LRPDLFQIDTFRICGGPGPSDGLLGIPQCGVLRQTKIVATIGPASSSIGSCEVLLDAHGTWPMLTSPT